MFVDGVVFCVNYLFIYLAYLLQTTNGPIHLKVNV